ncbi:serum paraoxonase/arylesterase 2-like [Diadema antillarum]|uniref:serum paraoxonase/arylesterase 2-like n=1 Tax=Diadema antillarum TaxID=105358 RepID=UPI003A870BDF
MWRVLLISFLVVVVGQHLITFLYIMGYHKYVYKHRPGNCRKLAGIDNGMQDIEVFLDGFALVASVKPKCSWSTRTCFKDSIEIFELHQDASKLQLKFLRQMQDIQMRRMSDVQAVGPRQFYITNEGYHKDFPMHQIEHYMMFPWGGVVYCDGDVCRQVSNPLYEPSGIQLSPVWTNVKMFIYISTLYGMGLQIYSRDASDNLLSAQSAQAINLGSLVDKVSVDGRGNLWAASHPVAHKLKSHLEDRRNKAPSQILHVKFDHNTASPHKKYEVFEMYSDDGTELSASSVVVFRQSKLLIGSRRGHMLLCEVQAGR